MFAFRSTLVLGVLAAVSVAVPLALASQRRPGPKPMRPVAFAIVAPIFKKCSLCHQGAKPKHGLDLTSYANLMKGDKQGKVVVPGNPATSRLSKSIHRSGAAPMPPMGPLPAADIAKIDSWIKSGAHQ